MLKQTRAIPNAGDLSDGDRRQLTYEQFLRRESLDGLHEEWVEGAAITMSPITVDHNDLTLFLLTVLGVWVQAHDLGTLKYEPFQMKAGPDLPGRSPDILFVAKKNAARIKRTYLDGPADLVVEVISEGSRGVDRGDKYYEYERGGVREYWLLDPIRKQAEFYVRAKGGIYQLALVQQDIYRSTAIKGVWIDVRWLWKKPAPSTLEVMKTWNLT